MTFRSPAWISVAAVLALGAGLVLATAPRTAAQGAPGSERQGFLGVSLQDLNDDLRDSYDYRGAGALVTNVVADSPAEKIGVREGDILTRLDDRSVSGSDQATEFVRARRPGTLVSVWVWRDGKERNLGRAELGDVGDRRFRSAEPMAPVAPRAPRARPAPNARPTPEPAPAPGPGPRFEREFDLDDLPQGLSWLGRGRLGVQTHDLDKDLGGYFDRPNGGGVLVLDVIDDTPAAKAGLKSGDVILSVGGKDVSTTEELRHELGDRDAGAVDLRIVRGGAARTMSVTLEESPAHGMMHLGDGKGVMGWRFDGDGRAGRKDDKVRRHVIRSVPRLRVLRELDDLDDNHEIEGMSPEDRKEFQKDMEELRKDLREMRRDLQEMHDSRRR